MYGAWHVHFESPYDTGNDLKTMLDEYESIGAKRVTVTEHDVFTSFIDLRDMCKDRTIDVIPGVEGTFTDAVGNTSVEKAHMILVARDKIGFRSLSKIITDANRHFEKNPKDKRPIITWENLEKNVAKGHLIYSSACIQGIFGQILRDGNLVQSEKRDRIFARLDMTAEEEQTVRGIEDVLKIKKDNKTITSEDLEAYKENHKKFLKLKRAEKELSEISEYQDRSMEEKLSDCDAAYHRLCKIFGKENVWFELQNHGLLMEEDIYPKIADLLDRYETANVLLSNDTHVGKVHPTETDFIRRNVAQYNRYHTVWEITDSDRELYIKDDNDLMNAVGKLSIRPEIIRLAMENVKTLLSSVEVDYLYEKSASHYPKFSDHAEEELKEKVQEGIKTRFPEGFSSPAYEERLQHELSVITSMGYADYHLIVQDYDQWTKLYGYCVDFFSDHSIDFRKDLTGQTITLGAVSMTYQGEVPTLEELKETIQRFHIPKVGINLGPGRGSAVGALVCYLLGISDIDPVQYNLLFERFLNPERKSMPDIDCDFRPDIRAKAIEYTKMKYGNTCKIITKSYGKLSGNLRLAARYLGTKEWQDKKKPGTEQVFLKPWYNTADRLSKSLDKKAEDLPEDELARLSGRDKQVYDLAKDLDGLFMSFGQHAGGNIISGDDITDFMPLFWNEKKANYSTQCDHDEAEAQGFLKMDFLGLINLGILTDMMRETQDTTITDMAKREELLNDPNVYQKIFSTGLTQGVFQFESDGMKQLLRDFQPEKFEDLILLVALYRPGPLQYKDEIIATKRYQKGMLKDAPEKSIRIDNDVLKKILAPTYGCIIYQEQVMQIFEFLAGYSLGDADLVRRAMAKKNLDKLTVERKAFLYGDPERDIRGVKDTFSLEDEELTPYDALFDQMLDFASYAFNKSHAAAYSLVSFFTAYFKCYHPGTFYEVSLKYTGNTEEVAPYAAEMKSFGLSLHAPDLLHSKPEFWYDGEHTVYYGYTRIKGMDKNVRYENQTYDSPDAFYEKNPLSLSVLLLLTKAGVFKEFGTRKEIASFWNEKIPLVQKYERIRDGKQAEEVKKKKLSELPEIPTFVSSGESETNAYPDDFETLGVVFPDAQTMQRMRLTNAFSQDKTRVKTGAVVCKVNKDHPVHSKGSVYYETYLMDKTGTVRKYLFDHPEEADSGVWMLSRSPWSGTYSSCRRESLPAVRKLIFNAEAIAMIDVTDLLCKVVRKPIKEAVYQVFYGSVLLTDIGSEEMLKIREKLQDRKNIYFTIR